MSEKVKVTIVIDDEKPNTYDNEKNAGLMILTQETDMTLMSVLLRNHLMEGNFCGGRGDCGRCVIQFQEGAPLPTGLERARLSPEELRQGYRLACVTRPKRDCVIKIPYKEKSDTPIVTEVNLPSGKIDSNGQKRTLPENRKPDVTESEMSHFIIAVDLGTTTIAMQLRDAKTGEIADTYCEQNPQRSYGADVLSRIVASCSGGREELQTLAGEVLVRGLRQFMAYLGNRQDAQILCMCIAGNTAMEHLLLGYDVESLGKAPFVPVDTGLQKIAGAFPVYVAPCISAFVGGDIVAGLYALRMLPVPEREPSREEPEGTTHSAVAEREGLLKATLLIDLGTNGEMAMTDGRRMIVTATAAGPAFEGRGDLMGTDRIALTAELLRRGILDETGLMAEPWFEEGVAVGPSGKVELAEDKRKTSDTKDSVCYFMQEDVRALQMAKAAVRAGVEILWEEMGCPEVDCVYLAGGFGYYLDVEASIAIGLLPAYMRGRVQAVGNTSLAGAYEMGRALCLEETTGEELEKRLSDIESINLAKKEKFEGLYLKYMNLEEN